MIARTMIDDARRSLRIHRIWQAGPKEAEMPSWAKSP